MSAQSPNLHAPSDEWSPQDGGEVLRQVAHRPAPLPERPWAMQQRWNDLLFAHWPIPAAEVERTLPAGLTVDTFDGWAWLGVVPFAMDQIHLRGMPSIPGVRAFPELNLRTYVRERNTNRSGVYFYSLDASNPLAVAVARTVFQLPYFWARMSIEHGPGEGRSREIHYTSRRLFSRKPARFEASYRGLGTLAQGPLEQFLTARYSLFTTVSGGRLRRGDIHHLPWPLERAEAEFARNELPSAHGFALPSREPVLHYARELMVYIWSLEPEALVLNPHHAGTTAPSPVTSLDHAHSTTGPA